MEKVSARMAGCLRASRAAADVIASLGTPVITAGLQTRARLALVEKCV
jgi:hypothetical protein